MRLFPSHLGEAALHLRSSSSQTLLGESNHALTNELPFIRGGAASATAVGPQLHKLRKIHLGSS